MGRVVLVTGVSRHLGARAAEKLLDDPGVDRVIGVDPAPPGYAPGRVEYVAADLHDDSVSRVVRDSGADTVLHLGLATAPESAEGRTESQANHVLGTMQLLAACQRSTTVRRLVVRSSAAVYGAAAHSAELYTEDLRARDIPRSAYAQDAAEVERHTRGLARRRPDMSVAVLRLANLIGPSMETPLARYFGLRVVPTVRGYDPRMQFIHEDDAVEALSLMAVGDGAGVFNVAAPGAIPLSQCLRRAGRPGVAMPERGLRMLRGLARRGRIDYSPEQLRLLCSDRVMDVSKLQRTVGWSPAYTSQETFEAFLAERGVDGDGPKNGRERGRDRDRSPVIHRVRAAVGRS
ncbi:epimerase [Nocardiopsis gilva YIM 90087]|uniref:Epimerase n=1 Tax=Nocardiopsis gilva YIM 90087 TaxID=1235441 RepID=A0A223S213_9ACTN|nr:NAD-dependent epimerase/dehydratase family protein [Nocardiopsis gilva]ASU82161.1 epimerase [Nocardiopsis gilva YIM 90087]